jgi:dGTPase
VEWAKLLSAKRVGELMGKEKSKEDSRTPFERDYGRAVFSTPVRRLQDKTQVFPLEEHDAVRTRLTHSLEVSSVARNLGRQVGAWLQGQDLISVDQIHDIETISATCGLIHDLGNPPFGHSGETAIQSWFESRLCAEGLPAKRGEGSGTGGLFEGLGSPNKKGKYETQFANDFLKWEGNAQTLRLISRLQVLADEYGINLTCATFSAAMKYVSPSNELAENDEPHEKSKPGFFASENETVKKVQGETGTVGIRHPITYLVEASDDIVYATGDLEDGVRKGILHWDFLKRELQARSGGSRLVDRVVCEAEEKVGFDRNKPHLLNEEATQAFRTFSIGAMKDAAFEQFCRSYKDVRDGRYHGEIVRDKNCEAATFVDACTSIGVDYVYPSPPTLKLELMGRRVIHDLMNVFWEGARVCGAGDAPKECKKGFAGKAYKLISSNYKNVFLSTLKKGKLPERYCRLQLVTDHIAGMTDSFAMRLHKRLMNG